jgi:hypothetical protein
MALKPTSSIAEISGLLREMGEDSLAERLGYLASEEDLDPGESPATPESARGFFEFFASVESQGNIGLSCSPDGWLCAEWRISDKRVIGIWFLDADRMIFSATDDRGEFVEMKERNKVGKRSILTESLVERELFVWRPKQ